MKYLQTSLPHSREWSTNKITTVLATARMRLNQSMEYTQLALISPSDPSPGARSLLEDSLSVSCLGLAQTWLTFEGDQKKSS